MPMPTDERRRHPRYERRYPLTLESPDRASIQCESVDVSVGGMRIRSQSRIPLGPCDLVISAAGDDTLALHGEVLEEVIDASTGEVTARIVFVDAPVAAIERAVVAKPRRRGTFVLAGAIAAGILAIGGTYVATRDDGAEPRSAVITPAAEIVPSEAPAAAPIDPPPTVASSSTAPIPTPIELPTASPAPAPAAAPAAEPAPAPPAEPAPAPAPAPRVERSDDLTRVVLGSSAEDTAVMTTTRPSAEGDVVRVQLRVTPEPDGTTLPVAVTIENRGAETLRFPDGLRATITASQDGSAAAETTLASDVVELAPGATVTVEGFLDFGATGEYDVTASTEVA